jgi:PAS domain-containing protein
LLVTPAVLAIGSDFAMATRQKLGVQTAKIRGNRRGLESPGSLEADIIIVNALDPVSVSDLEGKILQANDAVFALLGFRPDELIEQSLSRIISTEETRAFLAALWEVVERVAVRACRAGACGFMKKPLDRDFFVASLYRAIRAHARIRRLKDRQVALGRGAEWIAERARRELRRGPVRGKS